ncbi:glycosyltransferase [Vreelandella zhanjiangensis]|uniref:glycosyltransferase n=1 Tax=Vreelandella zhanjiangensis TaxID=1121960 RepID=UPI00037AE381|nr:glycosyltransferase [Halomonas zhanjiangensis]
MSNAKRALLLESGLFDETWYVQRYPDTLFSQMSPLEHFLNYGWTLGRCPGPYFDPEAYRNRYPDISGSGLDPLMHYICHGRHERRFGQANASNVKPVVRLAVVVHAYHLDLVALLGERLALLSEPFDLFITTPHAHNTPEITALQRRFNGAEVVTCPNQGRDIAPFFSLLPRLQSYELCLKLHTKQGVTPVAKQWRDALVSSVLPSREGVQRLVAKLRSDPRLQLAGPKRLFMSQQAMRFGNERWLAQLAKPLGVPLESDWGFLAGSMFWCRPQALLPLAQEVTRHQFEPETGQQDGELAHALERLVGGIIQPQEGQILLLELASSGEFSIAPYRLNMPLESTMPSRLLAAPSAPSPGSGQASSRLRIAGDLNLDSSNAIRGWLASRVDPAPREITIRIDGVREIKATANHFRTDLRANGLHQGRHAFDIYPPVELLDGQPHVVELLDAETGECVASKTAHWAFERSFSDFSGYLAHTLVNPYVAQPFREADKRCFAAMENVARILVEHAQALTAPPLVSVIMPCFNRLETIEEAVNSVLEQSYASIELILIDDGSEDGTAQWCERCASANPQVKALLLNENGGVSAARNRGLEAAQGEYVMYLDSDNRWDTRFVAAMVGAFENLPHAEALYSGLYRYHGDSEIPAGVMFGPLNRSLLFNRNYVDLNTFVHRRQAWQRLGGFDEALPRYVDWDLVRRYALDAELYSVPVILTHYYIDKASNSLTNNSQYLPYLEAVREKTGANYAAQPPKAQGATAGLERGVTIVIPSYESKDDLQECLESLYALNLGASLEIIVVDNHSSEAVCAFIRKEHDGGRIKAVFNDANFGFTHAVNLGIHAAQPEYDIVLLNNDSIVTQGALEAMQRAAYSLPDCGLVVPQQVLPGGTKTLNDHVPFADASYPCDVNISKHHANVHHVPLFHDGKALEINFAPFFCVYIPRHVYRDAGDLDAQYGRHYRSDRIYCDVVRHILGLKIYHVSDALIYHKLQKSTDELAGKKVSEFDIMFKKNRWDPANKKRLGFIDAPWDM